MEQAQLHKKVDTLRQEKKKLQENWALLKHHLEDLNAICKDQEEETSDLKIQQQQVGSGTWYQLRFAIFSHLTAFLLIHASVHSHILLLTHAPTQTTTHAILVISAVSLYKYFC
ncbi:hypothetical protein I79_023590 [Cricetulus griseus]|uniref:Uncharacterized protein n=1 Tax=Cricetulus griseus TaxID=10029 RepID=G3IIC2_CRIGR|nr:hypothetical protein I79_023590 [Cricetulus griseus]